MKLTFRVFGKTIRFYPEGEIDECSVQSLRKEVDEIIDNNAIAEKAIFNLSAVKFMDSTGIGFLIGRYKKTSRLGMEMYVESPALTADKVLSVSGVYNLIPKI